MPIPVTSNGSEEADFRMPMIPVPPTKAHPHNKSPRAKAAETRGERVWTGWQLRELVDQVLRCNSQGVTEEQIRAVRNLEYLKVKLIRPSEMHHTGLRMPGSLQSKKDQYFQLNQVRAEQLKSSELENWRANPPTDEELDEAVENLTGRRYYRERKLKRNGVWEPSGGDQ